jgi:heme/copper-type cytochrome/quinol oxidase subunit 2
VSDFKVAACLIVVGVLAGVGFSLLELSPQLPITTDYLWDITLVYALIGAFAGVVIWLVVRAATRLMHRRR